MIIMPRSFVIVCVCLCLIGCTASIQQYKSQRPSFDVFEYFQGKIFAWGMVQDYQEKQTRRFFVAIDGTVNNDTLVLEEAFHYHDGSREQRTWHIRQTSAQHYTGTANDIHGEARGVAQGNALQWRYAMDVMVDGEPIRLQFDDWMFRQDEHHVFNITTLRKFGIEVGRVTLFFQKQAQEADTPAAIPAAAFSAYRF